MAHVGESVGRHYRGELGEEYFDWQGSGADVNAAIESTKFAPHVSPTDTVVDFGCGAGALLAKLRIGEGVGVEPNPPARGAAKARGVRVVASTGELEDAMADVVISNHALEHTLAPLSELRELRRILKPGGRLVLWLPLDDWNTQRHSSDEDVNHHL